jgi:hypothetical protein
VLVAELGVVLVEEGRVVSFANLWRLHFTHFLNENSQFVNVELLVLYV